jgi:hypothetical protein
MGLKDGAPLGPARLLVVEGFRAEPALHPLDGAKGPRARTGNGRHDQSGCPMTPSSQAPSPHKGAAPGVPFPDLIAVSVK